MKSVHTFIVTRGIARVKLCSRFPLPTGTEYKQIKQKNFKKENNNCDGSCMDKDVASTQRYRVRIRPDSTNVNFTLWNLYVLIT